MQTQLFGYVHTASTRAQIPIFDTTQMGDFFVNCGYLEMLPFPGALFKTQTGYFWVLCVSHFDFRQRLPYGKYAFVQYRSLRKHAHMQDMCSDTTCRITPFVFHMQGVSPIDESG